MIYAAVFIAATAVVLVAAGEAISRRRIRPQAVCDDCPAADCGCTADGCTCGITNPDHWTDRIKEQK